jgi:hypothetical protein
MKLSESRRNLAAEKSGRWIDCEIEDAGRFAVKVRGLGNPDYLAKLAALREERSPDKKDAPLSADELADLILDTVLLDWRGIDDAPPRFDRDFVRGVLVDEEQSDLLNAIIVAARRVGRDKFASLEQDAKN